MWALIEKNFVIEITEVSTEGRFHPDFIWVKCTADTVCGMIYTGSAFVSQEETAPEVIEED